MLSIGFYPDMKQIQSYLPDRRINGLMFSATFPGRVLQLANEFLRNPGLISLSGKAVHVAEVEHIFYEVPGMGKERSLIRIIEMENPSSAIIFCNTKSDVHFVTAVLQQFGYDADELSADLSQTNREKVLARVRSGNLRFLVATDVAARGIDIPDLSHVILYVPPEDPESYIHRAGRTGRAGAAGTAITLVNVVEKMELKRIMARYEIKMEERELPGEEEVRDVVEERIMAHLEARLRKLKPLERERMQRFVPLAERLGENAKELHVLAMLLDELYQKTLHAPPPAPKAPKEKQSQGPAPEKQRKRKPRKRKRTYDSAGD